MTRAGAIRAALAIVLGGATAGLGVGPAGADAVVGVADVAWWTRSPVANAPEGGFEVGMQPDGVASVAAFTLLPAGELESASVTLTESGGSRQEQARLQLCVTTDRWEPAAGGPIDAAPETECAVSATLLRGGDGVWGADVHALLGDGTAPVSVVVMPSPSGDVQSTPAGPFDPGYTVQVAKVEATGVVSSAPPSFTGSDGDAGFDPGSTGGGFDPGPDPGLGSGFGSVDLGPFGGPAPGPDPPAAPAITGVTGAPRPSDTAFPVARAAASAGDGRPWGRLVLLVPLAALIGAAAAVVRDRLGGDDLDVGLS